MPLLTWLAAIWEFVILGVKPFGAPPEKDEK